MHGQEIYKTFDFLFLISLNNIINFNRVDLVFECHNIEFEWDAFMLKFFRK